MARGRVAARRAPPFIDPPAHPFAAERYIRLRQRVVLYVLAARVDASGKDEILVGRIRRDLSDATGRSISIFSAGDQLLKGAALECGADCRGAVGVTEPA